MASFVSWNSGSEVPSASAFSEALGISVEELGTVLGKISSFDESLSTLDAETANATEALDCRLLNGAYTDVTYNGVCDTGARALTWIFTCLGAIAISGMSIITLRIGWRDVIDFVDPTEAQEKGVIPYDADMDEEDYDEAGVEVIEEEMMASYDDEDLIYDADYTGAASYTEGGGYYQ